MGSFCCKVESLVAALFGSLLIQANYEHQYGPSPESEDKAKSLISWLFLIGNVMRVPLTFYFGYLSDRGKIWALISLLTFISILLQVLMLVFLYENSFYLMISFTGVYTFNFTIYMLSLTMLSKLVKSESRGTVYAAFGLIGSIGVLIANELGAYLYDNVSH
jgi:predicted MFS family arabinose efflux permease